MKSNAQAPANDTEDRLPIVGRSAAMQDIYRTVARLMNTDLTAMITGESGTGKELVARALHDFGRRAQRIVRGGQHGRDTPRVDRK